MKNIPFPQANDLRKVIEINKFLPCTKSEVKTKLVNLYGFSPRQADYYLQAGIWLGIYHVDVKNVVSGQSTFKDIEKIISTTIRENIIFKNARENLHLGLNEQRRLIVGDLVLHSNMSTMTKTTHYRRASTVIKWINDWEELKIE